MCKKCRLLGALINAGEPSRVPLKNTFDLLASKFARMPPPPPISCPSPGRSNEERFKTGETLACCDFRPDTASVLQFKDKHAEAYLEPAVQALGQNGINVVPIEVDSDGSCLTHAVSRSLYVERALHRAEWTCPAPCLQLPLRRPLHQVRSRNLL